MDLSAALSRNRRRLRLLAAMMTPSPIISVKGSQSYKMHSHNVGLRLRVFMLPYYALVPKWKLTGFRV